VIIRTKDARGRWQDRAEDGKYAEKTKKGIPKAPSGRNKLLDEE
jgi:hypothetical protein